MLYTREITDPEIIQFIILYTLNGTDKDPEYSDLVTLVMDNCNVSFPDFQIALVHLEETGHIYSYMEGKNICRYGITDKGANAIKYFRTSVPVYIREPIDESIKQLYIEERRKNAVQSGIMPVRKDEYGFECILRDDDKTEMMRLYMYAGSRDEAEKLAKYFKAHPEKIYGDVLNAFKDADKEDDEE